MVALAKVVFLAQIKLHRATLLIFGQHHNNTITTIFFAFCLTATYDITF